MYSGVVGKILSFCFGSFLLVNCLSMAKVLFVSFSVLPTQCFALVMVTIPVFRSMSLSCNQVSSIGLVPKSFDMDRNRAIRMDAFAISMFRCSVVGIFGILSYRW